MIGWLRKRRRQRVRLDLEPQVAERGVAAVLAEVETQLEANYQRFRGRADVLGVSAGMGEGTKLVRKQKDLIVMKELLSNWDAL